MHGFWGFVFNLGLRMSPMHYTTVGNNCMILFLKYNILGRSVDRAGLRNWPKVATSPGPIDIKGP